ncbi:MAG: flotillin-like FloA family protein [Verrucomicrobiae bacterium]|nr:flotillin-like FloA family protein [Verrucomicrobiae bacterium]
MGLLIKERLMMFFRGSPSSYIIATHRTALANGLDVTLDELEAHHLCGGDPGNVITQLLKARDAGFELDWERACAIELATKGSHESLELAVDQAIHPGSHIFEQTLGNDRPWNVAIVLLYRIELSRYVGGAEIDVLEERIRHALEESYSSWRSTFEAAPPKELWENEVMSKELDSGTRLRLLGCRIVEL